MCADEKRVLRERAKALRQQLKNAEDDGKILREVLRLPYDTFFIYYSVGSEVDTHALISALLGAGKTVCLPKIVGKEMHAVRYFGESLKKDAFGIPAPEGADMPCPIALVPLLAVDTDGNRLGYGGGYYDRYFADHPSILKIGLCYGGQVLPVKLPKEDTDVPLDGMITENGFFPFERTERK